MTRRKLANAGLGITLLLVGCIGQPSLDTRSFELRHLEDRVALQLIDPYVYGDREGAPGTMTAVQGILTVRETRDNLDRIARVLEEFDKARQSITLTFQIIFGDGASSTDPAIAEVVTELRKLFRFEGYQLRASGVMTSLERTRVGQTMFDQVLDHETGFVGDVFSSYDVSVNVGSVSGPADSSVVELAVHLSGGDTGLLETSVVLGIGHTVVLGTLQLPSNRALILTVRAELAE